MAITLARLRELVEYDPETGVFRSRINRGRARVGKVLGGAGTRGYIQLVIERQHYKGHHLAWFHVHGEWPQFGIDHKNGDTGDNRIANLRAASQQQNVWNARRPKTNKSGLKGVSLDRAHNKWRAAIVFNHKQIHLGRFSDPELAYAAYVAKAQELFGEFARVS